MTSSGIIPSKAMDYLDYIEGCFGKVAFRRKDAYNYLTKQQIQKIRYGEVNTALSMLSGMKLHDKDMVFEYTVDNNEALTRLFWADGVSKAEFDLFGDVVVFDSTYKTNAYHFPLVIMSSVNNHFNTCVFSVALLYNESIESYRWLLQKFRETMGGKMLISVLTDQDAAMHAAIEIEFPLAKHRICSWHLERNAMQNTYIPDFARDMAQLLKKKYSIEKFDSSWYSLISRYGLDNHQWVNDIFKKKELWGETYFRGHFFGMMRSTQRSESVNSSVKLMLKPKMKLTDFLTQYHFFIQKIRSTFLQNQENSEKLTPSLLSDALQPLERHAASIYTKNIFEMVSKEIWKEQELVVEEAINHNVCKFTFKFGSYGKTDGKRFSVNIDWEAQNFQCECERLESDGLPCWHLISAFKLLHLREFPEKCIIKRWTIAMGEELKCHSLDLFPFKGEKRKRFALLNRECANLCFQSSQSKSTTIKQMMHIRDLAKELEDENLKNSQMEDDAQDNTNKLSSVRDPKESKSYHQVRDPAKVRSRGAPKAKRIYCEKCGQPGHKANSCNLNPNKLVAGQPCGVRKMAYEEVANTSKEDVDF